VSPWKLPLIVAAIAVPIAFAFYLGGPGIGVGVGALAAVGIVYAAVRQAPRGRIGPAPKDADQGRALVVLADRLEQPQAVERVSSLVGDGSDREATVMVLAPTHIGFLDRWASDVEAARRDAQQRLVVSVAALAAAGIHAEARVGDEDIVQAVEDQLGSFPAAEVILVFGASDAGAARAARELRTRLRPDFHQVLIDPVAR
jgi:hypothetical protein